MQAAGQAELVIARDSRHPGPHSIGHAARFVVDHAPCTVVLAWPESGPRPAPEAQAHASPRLGCAALRQRDHDRPVALDARRERRDRLVGRRRPRRSSR